MTGPGPGNMEPVGIENRPLGNSPADVHLNLQNPKPPSFASFGDNEKPLASGHGVSLSIPFAEPIVYLTGLDHDGTTRNSESNNTLGILRGKVRLNVTKSVKIKSITLTFRGIAKTQWPDGVPPGKLDFCEEESLRTQVLPFFNALYEGSEVGYGTHCNYYLRDKSGTTTTISPLDSPSSGISTLIGARSRANTLMTSRESKRLSLQSNQSRSFQKGDSPNGPTPQQKGYKTFHPGVYEYTFEMPIDNNSPETTKLPDASVKWQVEAMVERASAFRPNLMGIKEVPVIRTPSIESLELVEPISISRNWDDQLHYDIMISGKSFPLGSRIPIAFKLTPLAKVQIHKIRIYVTESIDYSSNGNTYNRKGKSPKKILLFEKLAGQPPSSEYSNSEMRVLRGGELTVEERAVARATAQRERERLARQLNTAVEPLPEESNNILGDLDLGLDHFACPTELELSVQLPTCEMMEKDKTKRLHHDCSWKNARVHHWFKIAMRISRKDPDDPSGKKRRHFEISIDSPFTILSCQASQMHMALPAYCDLGGPSFRYPGDRLCGCPNAASAELPPISAPRDSSLDNLEQSHGQSTIARPETAEPLTRPPQAHLAMNTAVQRPIHMLRNPSFAAPEYEAEEPPPPMPTPPPMYDLVVGTPSVDGLADYFTRLADYEEEYHTDDEDVQRASTRGRVNVVNPYTPGGRIARSMDINRDFMFNLAALNRRINRGGNVGGSEISNPTTTTRE
ncbi:1b3bce51-5617-4aa5-8b1d-a78fb18bc6e4 [Sclerotinia trifoliorum]|uniref:1b3bce51-5617-4aa5-8b1d-a78fb18bc6e4 n=1 Tax=Sclerotinia trifoliorum TaxID=28548 RepID=A0A8H2VT89_9HELO|nr:1b3bce51-5617-4aa5-8b1d-a78fb18bc6e4 [Sclerotinia trifoliorum]